MARHRKDLGERGAVRIELRKAGYLILAPNAPWIECMVINVSDTGICLGVGSLAVPPLFGIAFTASGDVVRVCHLIWRQGEQIGARFVSARELRTGFVTTGGADQRKLEELVD